MTDATCRISAGFQVAAIEMFTGNMVVGLVHTIPCRLWFQPFITGIFKRSIAGAVVESSEIFSAGVRREMRSSTRLSNGSLGSR